MKTNFKNLKNQYKYSNFNESHKKLSINNNFKNSQNYILGKSEKKKIVLKLFIENFLKIKNFFKLPYKKDIFYNFFDGVNLNDLVNKNYGNGTPLKLKTFLYVVFVIIFTFITLLYLGGINFFLSNFLMVLFLWGIFILFFLYINIFFLFSFPFLLLFSILYFIYLFIKFFIFNGYNSYYIIKYVVQTKIVNKFIIIDTIIGENNFYKIIIK